MSICVHPWPFRVLPRALRGFGLAACLVLTLSPVSAAPVWSAPKEIPFGTLGTLELREADPSLPAPPRPGDDRLGPFELRGAEPLADGRGWRLTVQPLVPGTLRIPVQDLGDGRRTPELRVLVPRTTPFGAPMVGVGGGQEDVLPQAPFPWAWASLGLIPLALFVGGGFRLWRRGRSGRTYYRALQAFRQAWPPVSAERSTLDQVHRLGRNLLAARFGEEARSWGAVDCHRHKAAPWGDWVEAMDERRFAGREAALPALDSLLKCLEVP
nr:hypothetical protein [uncultured Holophaga sp.]